MAARLRHALMPSLFLYKTQRNCKHAASEENAFAVKMLPHSILNLLRRSQTRFLMGKDAWAIRHINADGDDPRLSRLHLNKPGSALSSHSQDQHRYSDPNDFLKEHFLSPKQANRLKSIHETLATSEKLWNARQSAKLHRNTTVVLGAASALGFAGGAALLPFAPPVGMAYLGLFAAPTACWGVNEFRKYIQYQVERKASRKELGRRMLGLREGETTAVCIETGKKHATAACIKKLKADNKTYRLEVEYFDGHSNKSQKRIISFPQNALKKTKGVRADGLHALEDFLSSSKGSLKKQTANDIFTRKLNTFIKSVGGTLDVAVVTGSQKKQRMGNCLVHNPQQALFRAIEQDPLLGSDVSKNFQKFLTAKAFAVIQQSPAFKASEKEFLLDLELERKSRHDASKDACIPSDAELALCLHKELNGLLDPQTVEDTVKAQGSVNVPKKPRRAMSDDTDIVFGNAVDRTPMDEKAKRTSTPKASFPRSSILSQTQTDPKLAYPTDATQICLWNQRTQKWEPITLAQCFTVGRIDLCKQGVDGAIQTQTARVRESQARELYYPPHFTKQIEPLLPMLNGKEVSIPHDGTGGIPSPPQLTKHQQQSCLLKTHTAHLPQVAPIR